MVKITVDPIFDMLEIHHNSVGIKRLGAAIHGHKPVMAVKILAAALVGQAEAVRTGDFHTFRNVVHFLSPYRYFLYKVNISTINIQIIADNMIFSYLCMSKFSLT